MTTFKPIAINQIGVKLAYNEGQYIVATKEFSDGAKTYAPGVYVDMLGERAAVSLSASLEEEMLATPNVAGLLKISSKKEANSAENNSSTAADTCALAYGDHRNPEFDLDNYMSVGQFSIYVQGDPQDYRFVNFPTDRNTSRQHYYLEVKCELGTTMLTQLLYEAGSTSPWIRSYYGNEWSPWKRFRPDLYRHNVFLEGFSGDYYVQMWFTLDNYNPAQMYVGDVGSYLVEGQINVSGSIMGDGIKIPQRLTGFRGNLYIVYLNVDIENGSCDEMTLMLEDLTIDDKVWRVTDNYVTDSRLL